MSFNIAPTNSKRHSTDTDTHSASQQPSVSAASGPINRLAPEIVQHIASYLDLQSLGRLASVNTTFHAYTQDLRLERHIQYVLLPSWIPHTSLAFRILDARGFTVRNMYNHVSRHCPPGLHPDAYLQTIVQHIQPTQSPKLHSLHELLNSNSLQCGEQGVANLEQDLPITFSSCVRRWTAAQRQQPLDPITMPAPRTFADTSPHWITPTCITPEFYASQNRSTVMPDGRIITTTLYGRADIHQLSADGHTWQTRHLKHQPDPTQTPYVADPIVLSRHQFLSHNMYNLVLWIENPLTHTWDAQPLDTSVYQHKLLGLSLLHHGNVLAMRCQADAQLWKHDRHTDTWSSRPLTHPSHYPRTAMPLSNGDIATIANDHTIAIWRETPDQSTWHPTILADHTNTIYKIRELSRDVLVSTSHDCTIRIWTRGPSPDTWTSLKLTTYTASVNHLDVFGDNRFVTASYMQPARLWRQQPDQSWTSVLIDSAPSHISSLRVTPSGHILTALDNSTLITWQETPEGTWAKIAQQVLGGPHTHVDHEIIIDPHQGHLITTSWYNKVHVWHWPKHADVIHEIHA